MFTLLCPPQAAGTVEMTETAPSEVQCKRIPRKKSGSKATFFFDEWKGKTSMNVGNNNKNFCGSREQHNNFWDQGKTSLKHFREQSGFINDKQKIYKRDRRNMTTPGAVLSLLDT